MTSTKTTVTLFNDSLFIWKRPSKLTPLMSGTNKNYGEYLVVINTNDIVSVSVSSDEN